MKNNKRNQLQLVRNAAMFLANQLAISTRLLSDSIGYTGASRNTGGSRGSPSGCSKRNSCRWRWHWGHNGGGNAHRFSAKLVHTTVLRKPRLPVALPLCPTTPQIELRVSKSPRSSFFHIFPCAARIFLNFSTTIFRRNDFFLPRNKHVFPPACTVNEITGKMVGSPFSWNFWIWGGGDNHTTSDANTFQGFI